MVAGKFLGAAALAGLAAAAPVVDVEKRANLDATVLQFALTLEHLEKNFYNGALAKFSEQDFAEAGFDSTFYNNLKYITYDEDTHVAALKAAISAAGYTPTKACTYSFPYTTPLEFVTLSSVIEGLGTSAYLGAAGLITNKQYLTTAGSILSVEALHTSFQRSQINEIPMANPFYTPVDPSSVYTLALMFITSCPSSNPKFPFTQFPTLQYNGNTCSNEEPSEEYHHGSYNGGYQHDKRWGHEGEGWPQTWHDGQSDCSPPMSGATINFTSAKNIPAGSYVTFISGLTVTSVQATNVNGKTASAKIPAGLGGQSYAFITSSNVEGTFDDSKVVAGPAVVEVKPAAPAI